MSWFVCLSVCLYVCMFVCWLVGWYYIHVTLIRKVIKFQEKGIYFNLSCINTELSLTLFIKDTGTSSLGP